MLHSVSAHMPTVKKKAKSTRKTATAFAMSVPLMPRDPKRPRWMDWDDSVQHVQPVAGVNGHRKLIRDQVFQEAKRRKAEMAAALSAERKRVEAEAEARARAQSAERRRKAAADAEAAARAQSAARKQAEAEAKARAQSAERKQKAAADKADKLAQRQLEKAAEHAKKIERAKEAEIEHIKRMKGGHGPVTDPNAPASFAAHPSTANIADPVQMAHYRRHTGQSEEDVLLLDEGQSSLSALLASMGPLSDEGAQRRLRRGVRRR